MGARGWGWHGVRLPDVESLIGRDLCEKAHPALAIRPLHFHRVEGVALSHTERQNVVHARLEAARRLELLEELLRPAPQRHLGSDGEPIRPRSLEPDLQEAVR